MPYPCCCRNSGNGLGCFACDLERTPLQWALTWPEWYVEYRVDNEYVDLFRMPAGTHILTQVPGGGVCCWSGPTFSICTTTQGVTVITRLLLWGYIETFTSNSRLTASWTYTEANTTPVQDCGTYGGNNRLGTVSWTKTLLAGCRAGPYTASVTGQTRTPGFIYGTCPQPGQRYFTQVAGSAILQDV